MTTMTHNSATAFNAGAFLDGPHGQRFWHLCDRALIRRAEAEAIVAAVACQVAAIKADPSGDDVAAALPDSLADDDEPARRQLALGRLRRQIGRLGVDPVPTEAELLEQIQEDPRLGIWFDIETLRQRILVVLHDHLRACGLDAPAVLAAGEIHGMVPRD